MVTFGRVKAVSAGNATITGTYQGIAGNALARVTATALESLIIITQSINLQVGTLQQAGLV